MNTFGHNSFVIEGSNARILYGKLMNSIENCVNFNTRYKIDKIKGNTYTIQKSQLSDNTVEYNIGVWKGNCTDYYSCPIGWSSFSMSDISFDHENLTINEDFSRGCGAIQKYICDKNFDDTGYNCYSWAL